MNLGDNGVQIPTFEEAQQQAPARPEVNEIESSINEFPNILPQGTTSARPIGPKPQHLVKLQSLSNLATTTPPASPFLNQPAGFVPGTDISK